MQEYEFALNESEMGGYLTNHKMTCGVSENSTTLCLSMTNPEGKRMDVDQVKILIYFPNGSGDSDLTYDAGKSITARLYGENWSLTYMEYHPVYKTKVWTLQPRKTFYMTAEDSVSVTFETIQVNSVPGMSKLCLLEKKETTALETDIQKFRVPETVPIFVKPESFVFGDDISVCFTVTDPGQYKWIEYCGERLSPSQSSFEKKEKAKCDAEYTVTITNQADYEGKSTYTVCLHGLNSFCVENISEAGVRLDLDLTEENVDQCRLCDEISGKSWELAAKSGTQDVTVEIREDREFYVIVDLRETARQDRGENISFHVPVIVRFELSNKDVLEEVDGFLSVKQVKEAKIQSIQECKSPPSPPAYTLDYELEHVSKCWLQTASRRYDVDVDQKSITIQTYDRSGTVHAVGDYGYEITKDIQW